MLVAVMLLIFTRSLEENAEVVANTVYCNGVLLLVRHRRSDDETFLFTHLFAQAVLSGAKQDSLSTISQSDIPLAYMTDQSHHFKIRVVGDLA